jgi:bacteriorhodopsin
MKNFRIWIVFIPIINVLTFIFLNGVLQYVLSIENINFWFAVACIAFFLILLLMMIIPLVRNKKTQRILLWIFFFAGLLYLAINIGYKLLN